MKNDLLRVALIDLQRRTGLVIEDRHEADARAVLADLYDQAHAAGVASVPVPGTADGTLTPQEAADLRKLLSAVAAKPARKK